MKFFIDTEFMEDSRTIDLLSIAIVCEDGAELYLELDADTSKANEWVAENVLPHLGKIPVSTREQARQQILDFIGTDNPEFWGYYADYDWVAICQLFGRMVDIPKGWPMYCRDIKQLCDSLGNPRLPDQDSTEHHALNDARWNRNVYYELMRASGLRLSTYLLDDARRRDATMRNAEGGGNPVGSKRPRGGLQLPLPVANHASFFSGIGGFDLGFERAGLKTVFLCEKKPFCRRVLKKHWPSIPLAEDIKDVESQDVPEAEVWTGGFPCQDLSVARMGPRAGLGGKKSGVFNDFIALVRAGRPHVVVLENVHSLLTSRRGRDFTVILKALDELGYGVAWRVLNSQYFGVPQSRSRVYIVAVYRDPASAGQILLEPERSDWDSSPRRSNGKKTPSLFQTILGNPRTGPLVKGRAHCIYAESARHTGTDWSRNYVWYPDGRVRRFVPVEIERIQGFPVGWTDAAVSGRDDPDSLRYHAVGNSVTPAVAEWLGRRLAVYLASTATARAVGE